MQYSNESQMTVSSPEFLMHAFEDHLNSSSDVHLNILNEMLFRMFQINFAGVHGAKFIWQSTMSMMAFIIICTYDRPLILHGCNRLPWNIHIH